MFNPTLSFFRIVAQNMAVEAFTITDNHLLGVEVVFEDRVSTFFGQDILVSTLKLGYL